MPDEPKPAGTFPSEADALLRQLGLRSEPPTADLGRSTLDPNRASDSVSITVLNQLVRPLVYFDAELNTVSEGGLAARNKREV